MRAALVSFFVSFHFWSLLQLLSVLFERELKQGNLHLNHAEHETPSSSWWMALIKFRVQVCLSAAFETSGENLPTVVGICSCRVHAWNWNFFPSNLCCVYMQKLKRRSLCMTVLLIKRQWHTPCSAWTWKVSPSRAQHWTAYTQQQVNWAAAMRAHDNERRQQQQHREFGTTWNETWQVSKINFPTLCFGFCDCLWAWRY